MSQYGGISQLEFIAILLADNNYDTTSQRKGWFLKRFGKCYADELTVAERSKAIEALKMEKESPLVPEDDESDD